MTMTWLVATPSTPATSDRKLYSKVDRVLEPAVPAKVAKSPFNVSDATVTGAVHDQLAVHPEYVTLPSVVNRTRM